MDSPPVVSPADTPAVSPPRDAGVGSAQAGDREVKPRLWQRFIGHPGLAAVALTAALLVVGVTTYRLAHRIVERGIQHRLELTVTLEHTLVTDWLEDSRSTLAAWSSEPDFIGAVERWRQNRSDPASSAELQQQLERQARTLHYSALALCVRTCAVPLLVAQNAAASHGGARGDHAADDAPHAVVEYPLRTREPELRLEAVLDLRHELARMSAQRVGDERGGISAAIAYRSGDRLVPLGSISAAVMGVPPSFEIPRGEPLPGRDSMWATHDEAGNPVLAMLRDIPGTPWTVVASVDASGAYADLRKGVLEVSVLGALLTALGTLWAGLSRQRTRQNHERLQAAADRARLIAELQHKVVAAQELERKRIVAQLHDDTGASLAAVQLNLKTLVRRDAVPGTEDASLMLETGDLLAKTVSGFRDFLAGLRPPEVVQGGLKNALAEEARRFWRRSGAKVSLELEGYHSTPGADTEFSIFRIVSESLNNCSKHANASHVTIRLVTQSDGTVLAEVIDDGAGFSTAGLGQGTTGQGLLIMRERAESTGGSLVVDSAPGKGCTVRLVCPAVSLSIRGT